MTAAFVLWIALWAFASANTITINTPAGSIVGVQGSKTENFKGIPFAEPPVGPLRFRHPVRLNKTLDNFDATSYAPACPQFLTQTPGPEAPYLQRVASIVTDNPLFKKALKISEDCLNLNVIRPAGIKAGDNVPVLVWIYGGGYEFGWNSMYDGSGIVAEAAANGKPYIFVSLNYRVGAWGFLAGKELLAEGSVNAAFYDQRAGLQWVADNIAAFGGDPSKVTLWGESAGSLSIFYQMAGFNGDITYKGKPLFRGGILNSGTFMRQEAADSPAAQATFDKIVATAGCSGAEDKLTCLRALSTDELTKAVNNFPAMLTFVGASVAYMPTIDGKFFTKSPYAHTRDKLYAPIPILVGDQEDEGTLFSLAQWNISSTTEGIANYIRRFNAPQTPLETVTQLIETYPQTLSAGSPYGTSFFNEIYPGFKRLAAVLGDITFTLTRRLWLELFTENNPEVPVWSFLSSYGFGTPILGTFHASDLVQVFFGVPPDYASKNIRKYYANFVYNLDPNDDSGGDGKGSTKVDFVWPKWTNSERLLINFNRFSFKLIKDDFRSSSYDILKSNANSIWNG